MLIQENEKRSRFILISSKDIAIQKHSFAQLQFITFSQIYPPIVVHMNMGRIQILTLFKSIYWLHFVTAKSYGQQRKMKQRQRAEVAPKSNSKLADLHETPLLTPHSG